MDEWLGRMRAAVANGSHEEARVLLAAMRADLGQDDPDAPVTVHRALDTCADPERAFLHELLGDAIGQAFLQRDRLDAAEPYLEQATQREGQRDPFDGLAYADALEQLGQLYGRQLRAAYALECANRCLAQRRNSLPEDDPRVAVAKLQIGALHREYGNFQVAAKHLSEAADPLRAAGEGWLRHFFFALFAALDAAIKSGSIESPERILRSLPGVAAPNGQDSDRMFFPALVALASIQRKQGEQAEAEALAARAQLAARARNDEEIWRQSYLDLAELQAGFGQVTEAIEALRWVAALDQDRAQRLLDTVHFSQRILYSDSLAEATGVLLEMALDKLPGDEAAARLALGAVLSRKALLTEADLAQNRRTKQLQGSGLGSQVARIETLRNDLRNRKLEGATDGHRRQFSEESAIERQLREEEGRLAASFAAASFPQAPRHAASDVAMALADDEALIEFVALRAPRACNPLERQEPDLLSEIRSARLAAFLLLREGPVRLFDLGPAEAIETLAYSTLAAMHPSGAAELTREWRSRCLQGEESDLGARLRALILDPLLRELPAQVRRLRIAPDGALAAVSFASLPWRDGRLLDEYEISCLSSGRVLLRQPAGAGKRAPPLILANPDYDLGPLPKPVDPGAPPAFWFAPLPNSAGEALKVRKRIGGELRLQADASRDALLGAASPAVLHVATHGFFLPPYSRGLSVIGNWRQEGFGLDFRGDVLSFISDEPLLRAGLALAGVNAYSAGADATAAHGDGLVTALDVGRLDLARTRLVFLSACSTARGNVRPGEGSAGLLQSFEAAGARSVVATLWATADHPATVTLVDRFYARLGAGDTVPCALRHAQRELKQLGAPTWVWASFAAYGDPRTTWEDP